VKTAIGVKARAPSAAGKTRLGPHLTTEQLHALRRALLADALATVCAYRHADPVLFVTPDDCVDEVRDMPPRPIPIVQQGGGDLGGRMRRALERLIDQDGYEAAILIGSDVPLLTGAHLDEAAVLLRTRGGVVLGPADDGGYYLIGMTRVCAALFEGIAWGSDTVLFDTLAAADRLNVDACLIRGAYDLDTVEDLRRLERDLAGEPADVAPHLRRCILSAR
jgi:rSAM/selenodomain-associated transferase 1